MKVKNGIASRISFFMIPNTRSGQRLQQIGVEQAQFHPDQGRRSIPTAASENATG
jgi:hypothetical protein